ncbi:MAG: tRNA (N6-isopentenyl adenosine(37)-C2)-methylthiotransferase MiaB [Gammaproteobacteria bacterium]|nr:tRNA (N6-isopentenyl adenosine(37)-C2)-methylthiotransferase MiaB [Gammaproteobacteria bacterium]
MKKKLYIKTHGCQMNEYDSAKMVDLLQEKENFEIAKSEDEADLLILNTCSIREKAQEKVFHQIGRWRKIKEEKPDLKIAIGGCVASQEGKEIIKRAPAVDIVFGPQTLHKLPELYKNKEKTSINQIDISFPKLEKFNHLPISGKGEPSAFVSIAEGCNKYCSFCVVPKTRGHEISRSVEDILNEVSVLADKGTREINFLGQNVNNFKGTFRGEKSSLARLIELAAKIENIDRIRFTTSHPHEFKDDLVEVYDKVPELVSHVHLPVQSGSDKILKLMRRRYNADKYLSLIDRIRRIRPNMSFSSDFIVGFPGETSEDFQDTINIINEVKFDESFSFIYSPRPNTTAAEMEDDVSIEEKKERLNILQSRLNQLSFGFSRKKVGTIQNCLIYGQSKRDPSQLQGRTVCNRIVNFQSNSLNLVGNLVNILIQEALPNSLRGNLEN